MKIVVRLSEKMIDHLAGIYMCKEWNSIIY